MGATPDNIFTCSCCENTCVEYKCPYSIRSEEVSDAWNITAYLELNGNELRLKKSHNYYAQIQGQMAIIGNRKTYFVVWTEKGNPFIEPITVGKWKGKITTLNSDSTQASELRSTRRR